MLKETKNYAQFKFMNKNRPLEKAHVKHMVESLKIKNLLHMHPVIVNSKMEVYDGQHRIKACEILGIPVKYVIDETLKDNDMLTLNVAKGWVASDYFNFHLASGKESYVKLDRWIKKTNISLRVALTLIGVNKGDKFKAFKNGELEFDEDTNVDDYNVVNETVNIITSVVGCQAFIRSSKFWKAMLFLVRSPEFNETHWYKNIRKMAHRVEIQITVREYLKMFAKIFNYYAENKIYIEKITEFAESY